MTGCPKQQVTADVWAALQAQSQAALGCWPVAGGWMEQTQSCVSAVQAITSGRSQIEAARRSGD